MREISIFHTLVHIIDEESDRCMIMTLKYNTRMIKPHTCHWRAYGFMFLQIWTSLYGPVLYTDISKPHDYGTFTFIWVHTINVHCSDVIMGGMASQITSLTVVYSTVYSGADQRWYQSSASLAFVRGIHRWPLNSPNKGPMTRRMFPFDDIIMFWCDIITRWGVQLWLLYVELLVWFLSLYLILHIILHIYWSIQYDYRYGLVAIGYIDAYCFFIYNEFYGLYFIPYTFCTLYCFYLCRTTH